MFKLLPESTYPTEILCFLLEHTLIIYVQFLRGYKKRHAPISVIMALVPSYTAGTGFSVFSFSVSLADDVMFSLHFQSCLMMLKFDDNKFSRSTYCKFGNFHEGFIFAKLPICEVS